MIGCKKKKQIPISKPQNKKYKPVDTIDLVEQDSLKSKAPFNLDLSVLTFESKREEDDYSLRKRKRSKKLSQDLSCKEKFELTYQKPDSRMCVDSENTEDQIFILSTKGIMEIGVEEAPYTEEDLEVKYNDEDHVIIMERQLMTIRNKEYMKSHRYINAYMRSMLFDWMMEVSRQFYFKRYTYHLAIVLVDVYLSLRLDIATSHLQLIGVTCLSLAAKTEVSHFKLNY
jgi:hypothetical protein